MLDTTTVMDRLREIVAIIFEMDECDIPDSLSQGMTSKWSSLNHLALLVALEEEFGLQFSLQEMSSLTSLPQIMSVLNARHTTHR